MKDLENNLERKLATVMDTANIEDVCGVVKDFSVSFSLFCAENCYYQGNGWWNRSYKDEALTTEELYNKFIENYGKENK